MALTGTHAAGETGKLADDNLRDVTINANTAAIANRTTTADVDNRIATQLAAERGTERTRQDTTYVQIAQSVVTGARDTPAALDSLLAALAARGIIINQTTATGAPGSAPQWYSSQVGSGTVGVAYSFTYVATGTPAPTYTVTLGTLPPGLTLASGGLLSGTPTTAGSYTFTVTATNGIAPDITRERIISVAGVAASVGSIYGPKVGFDTKSNIPITATQKLAYKFKAATSSALNAVRFTQRSGPGGYSAGNFGTMTVQVRPDDGAGHPHATTVLATMNFVPTGNNAGVTEVMDLKTFPTPATLTSGVVYWLVFTGSSDANYLSVNLVYCYNAIVPRQPGFADADFGATYTSGAWGALDAGHTPVVDFVYADGTLAGQPYYEAEVAMFAPISGISQMAREQFTVSGGNRTVTGAFVRVRRAITSPAGTSPLILTLQSIDPSTRQPISAIDSISIPAASIPASDAGSDNGGSVWVGGTFAASRILANGGSYALQLSTASGTTYTAMPIRQGSDMGYTTPAFTDGSGQKATSGSNWADIYPYGDLDLQFYFTM